MENNNDFTGFKGAREAPGRGQAAPAGQQAAGPSRQGVPPFRVG